MTYFEKLWIAASYNGNLQSKMNLISDIELRDFSKADYQQEFYDAFRTSVGYKIVATGSCGGIYGFVEDRYPEIAFIGSDGSAGRIAGSLEEMMELVLFYRAWHFIISPRNEAVPIPELIAKYENEALEEVDGFREKQEHLSQYFGIKKKKHLLEIVNEHLLYQPAFVTCACQDGSPSFPFAIRSL